MAFGVFTDHATDASSTFYIPKTPKVQQLVSHFSNRDSPLARSWADSFGTGAVDTQCYYAKAGTALVPASAPAQGPACIRQGQSNNGRCYWGPWDEHQACVTVVTSSGSDKATLTAAQVHVQEVNYVWEDLKD
jgi:hypothetical protein